MCFSESWSPEIEGLSDPVTDGTKLTYERDFLLQFQAIPMCMLKPEGLPDLEVVLGQARAPSKPGFQNRYCTVSVLQEHYGCHEMVGRRAGKQITDCSV